MSSALPESLRIGQTTVQLSSLERVFFPDDGITKGELIEYYQSFAERIVEQIAHRPLVLERFPKGLAGHGFIQQEAPAYFPQWVHRATVPRKNGGEIEHVVCDDTAALIYLVNQGVITPHPWLSRADRPTYPDQLIFDLDPPESDSNFEIVRQTALELRELLDEVGLPSYVKTTGGKGLHVTVPLARRHEVDAVLAFSHDVAETLADRAPDRLTTQIRKEKRDGRLYLDTARNGYGQTAVAPYAVRAKPNAPVAAPLNWEELTDSSTHPSLFTLRTMNERLKTDPWREMTDHATTLTKAQRRIDTVKPR